MFITFLVSDSDIISLEYKYPEEYSTFDKIGREKPPVLF